MSPIAAYRASRQMAAAGPLRTAAS